MRIAVRDLALAVLRSRVLTLPHVAHVATAIELGILPSAAPVKGDATHARAMQGLHDAMGSALEALDLAAHEYAAMGGRLSGAELESWFTAMDGLPKFPDRDFAARLASLRKSLRAAEDGEPAEGAYSLGLFASGTLLGLLRGQTPKSPSGL